MGKVVQYETAFVADDEAVPIRELDEAVQRAIAAGWQPLGGIAVHSKTRPNGTTYVCLMQALVRYADEVTGGGAEDDEDRAERLLGNG